MNTTTAASASPTPTPQAFDNPRDANLVVPLLRSENNALIAHCAKKGVTKAALVREAIAAYTGIPMSVASEARHFVKHAREARARHRNAPSGPLPPPAPNTFPVPESNR